MSQYLYVLQYLFFTLLYINIIRHVIVHTVDCELLYDINISLLTGNVLIEQSACTYDVPKIVHNIRANYLMTIIQSLVEATTLK